MKKGRGRREMNGQYFTGHEMKISEYSYSLYTLAPVLTYCFMQTFMPEPPVGTLYYFKNNSAEG